MQLQERIARISPHLVRLGRAGEFGSPQCKPDGSLVRLHLGHYLPREVWEALEPADQHLARLIAVQALAAKQPAFSHLSAVVLHGLPLYGAVGDIVHLTVASGGANLRSARIARHRADLAPEDIVEAHGLRFTSPERTILDLCALFPLETALACADAHLRESFRVGRSIDEEQLGEWRAWMRTRIAERRGRRGARAMRQLLELADARIDSVLESVSHLRLRQLGFDVELQVPVPGPKGRMYYVDFEFIGLKLFGECDGRSKYTDPRLLNGRSADEVSYQDKRRQDWICGKTRNDMIRWGYPDVDTEETFARRLRAFNVPMPPLAGVRLR